MYSFFLRWSVILGFHWLGHLGMAHVMPLGWWSWRWRQAASARKIQRPVICCHAFFFLNENPNMFIELIAHDIWIKMHFLVQCLDACSCVVVVPLSAANGFKLRNCVDGERVVGINIQIHHECRSISNCTVARHPDAFVHTIRPRGVRVPNLSSKYHNTLFDISLHNITRILHTF